MVNLIPAIAQVLILALETAVPCGQTQKVDELKGRKDEPAHSCMVKTLPG